MNTIQHRETHLHKQHSTTTRALLVIARYWPAIGGAEMHSREMLKHLQMQGVKPKVFCHASDHTGSNELASLHSPNRTFVDNDIVVEQSPYVGPGKTLMNVMAHAYPHSRIFRPFYNMPMRRFSARSIVDAGTDCHLIHNVYCGMTMVSEAALDAAKRLNIPFVFTPLARTCDGPKNAWSTTRLKRLYAGADAVIALTEHERDWLIEQGVAASKVHVCPMAPCLYSSESQQHQAPESNLRQKLNLGNKPIILFLGRHDESKGYRALGEARHRIWQTQPDAQLVFFGPQTNESKAYFETLDDARIHLIESPCQDLKMSALNSCDLLCVPSTKESLGVVYLEAWQSGKPVIAGDIPVLRKLIEHGKTGFVCGQNKQEVAHYVLRVLSNEKLSAKMGERGRALVSSTYTWPITARKINQVYQALVSSHRLHAAI